MEKYECENCGKFFVVDGFKPKTCPNCQSEKVNERLEHDPLPWRIVDPKEYGTDLKGGHKALYIVDAEGHEVIGQRSNVHREGNKRFVVKACNEYYGLLDRIKELESRVR